MNEKIRTIATRIRLPLIGIALFVGLAMVPVVFQTRQVTSFCADIHANMSVSELASVAETHGIDKKMMTGAFIERRKDWLVVIPVSPMSESKCVVRHDGKLVTSAEISPY
ncbi:MAG: hypothetical protein NUW21_14420 [Elusimicrobia bacterium]|nr:hypothetical protein [Elusimicrobiota bacterium]